VAAGWPRGRFGIRAAALALVIAVVMELAMVANPGQVAIADPEPSARDVRKSKQVVRERADEVGRIKARLAAANAALERVAIQAETAVERYNGELVKLSRAREDHAAAQHRLAEAERRYTAERAEAARFAADAYRSVTGVSAWSSLVGEHGGPQGYMDLAGLIEVLARQQAGALQRVEAARTIADIFREKAAQTLAQQHEAMRRAARAKREAEAVVAGRQAEIRKILVRKRRLEQLLAKARSRAERLEAKRQAALQARRRAALERRNRQSALTYARGRHSAVRGSSRGAFAVRAALKWLGTPYSWGGGTASGPSYGIAHGSGIRGFDCSGLALYGWAKAGVRLDHWTGTQWTSGPHIPTSMLRAGDLVFFAYDPNDPDTIHHVGIYIGRGKMVEAPYTGARVRISSIYRSGYIGATRPVA
jgi:peptidoglycan DL-endopeptidase RipA